MKLRRFIQSACLYRVATRPGAAGHCLPPLAGVAWSCLINQARDPATVSPWSTTSRISAAAPAVRSSSLMNSTTRASLPVHRDTGGSGQSPRWVSNRVKNACQPCERFDRLCREMVIVEPVSCQYREHIAIKCRRDSRHRAVQLHQPAPTATRHRRRGKVSRWHKAASCRARCHVAS